MSGLIYRDHWRAYLALGLVPLPASPKGKNPIPKWSPDLPLPCSDDYALWEQKYPNENLWVLLGDAYAVIDPDGPEAEDAIQGLALPPCPTSISGKRSVHRWFKVSSPLAPLKVPIGGNGCFLEVRTGRQGVLVPPSIHPETGKAYRWLEDHSPREIPFPELPREIYERIKSLLPPPEPKMMPAQTDNLSLGSLDIARYLDHHGIPFKVKQNGDRTIYALERCFFAEQHTTPDMMGDSSIIQGSDGKLGYHCFHNHCSLRTWQDARQVISGNGPIAEFCRGYIAPRQAKSPGGDLLREGILGVDEFLALEIPPMDYILSPWLTEQSLVLISGWRGTGKTWFGLSLLDTVSKRQDFGPWKAEKAVPCLYLDAEMPAPEIQYRLSRLGRSDQRKAPFYLYSDAYMNSLGMPRANLLNYKWRAAMKELLLSKGIKLWAMDNLASLTPNVDENLKIAWDPVNQFLIELRFEGITTIMFHHVSKTGDQRGTSAREDNVDLSIRLDRPPDYTTEDGARFILRFSKHRLRTKDLSAFGDVEFQLQEVEGQLTWTFTGTRVKNKVSVLRLFRDGIPQKEIPEAAGLSKGQVSKIKVWHLTEKHLTADGEVTEKGLEFIGGK